MKGPFNFFLQPGEKCSGKKFSILIQPHEALFLRASEEFEDRNTVKNTTLKRKPGDRWYCYGPKEYFPDVTIKDFLISLINISIFLI